MTWFRILFDGARTHLVHASMRDALIAEMGERGHGIAKRVHPSPEADPVRAVTEYGIDAGGMAIQGSPWIEVQVDDLPFSVPAEQVKLFCNAIAKLPVRTFSDGQKYQKLHGAWHCVVFTPEQMRQLAEKLEAKIEEAQRLDREFCAEHDKFIASRKKS